MAGSVPSAAESKRLLGPQEKKSKVEVPWVLTERDQQVCRLYGREVSGERPIVCRWCAEIIPAHQRRLKFVVHNSKGWAIKQGALHIEPCTQSPELIQHLHDEACEAQVTASQYAEAREVGLFEPTDDDLIVYPTKR